MDHGAVIRTRPRRASGHAATLLALGVLLALPGSAGAAGATLVEPADGHHFDHLERAPMVQFDPSKGATGKTEQPKWVLLATDPEMKTTVRYCRQFVWAAANGTYHWGCNRWATGVDQAGADRLLALDAGKVYYWQVVSTTEDGTGEVKSAVRSFAVDPERTGNEVPDVSEQINGTVFDDGSQLNLGAAALVNSGVRVSSIASQKLAPTAFRITLDHVGPVDYSRSYVKVTSPAGTRYLRVAAGASGVGTVWRLNAAERALRTKRFSYQAFLKSTKNGAMVRSQVRVLVIRAAAKVPKWTPDRRTVKPL